jgi:hypothetical protein
VEDPFPVAPVPLASSEERDYIYKKTVAPVPLSAFKRDKISTASVLFTATTAHFYQQLEMPLTERAKYTFNSKHVTIFGSSWRCH